jgi:hypothetical protein
VSAKVSTLYTFKLNSREIEMHVKGRKTGVLWKEDGSRQIPGRQTDGQTGVATQILRGQRPFVTL